MGCSGSKDEVTPIHSVTGQPLQYTIRRPNYLIDAEALRRRRMLFNSDIDDDVNRIIAKINIFDEQSAGATDRYYYFTNINNSNFICAPYIFMDTEYLYFVKRIHEYKNFSLNDFKILIDFLNSRNRYMLHIELVSSTLYDLAEKQYISLNSNVKLFNMYIRYFNIGKIFEMLNNNNEDIISKYNNIYSITVNHILVNFNGSSSISKKIIYYFDNRKYYNPFMCYVLLKYLSMYKSEEKAYTNIVKYIQKYQYTTYLIYSNKEQMVEYIKTHECESCYRYIDPSLINLMKGKDTDSIPDMRDRLYEQYDCVVCRAKF